jgi:mycofactocin precursor
MEQHTATLEPTAPAASDDVDAADPGEALVEDELLVEEISIDGMCGVY